MVFNVKDNLQKETQYKPLEIRIEDKDVYLHPKLKDDIESVMANIERHELFGTEMGYSGVLLKGGPGTGKTLYSQWIAKKSNALMIDGGLIGSPEQIKNLYQAARELRDKENKPVIIFLDEIDRFSSRDDVVDPTQATTLNQLLMEMDGTKSNKMIFTFGATNKEDKLDIALRRPGRFGEEIYFMPPDMNGRYQILYIHAYNKDHEFKVQEEDLKELAKITYGYVGADLKGVLIKSFTHANLEKRKEVTMEDLKYAFGKVKPSAIRDMPFKEAKIKLNDLCGYEVHKEVIQRIIGEEGSDLMLFYGSEGNGKTAFAEALAGEYGYNFIVVNASEPQDKFVGETEKKIGRYIERAKQLAPSILLFDKIDSLIEKKGMTSWKGSWTGLLESKLAQNMDGVTTIATVCDPTVLNDTFIGMFTHKLYFGNPTKEEQIQIWDKYINKNVKYDKDAEKIDSEKHVAINNNMTIRDIVHICRRIEDFGLPNTQIIYEDVLKTHQNLNGEIDYDSIRKNVGDSVLEFEKIRHILADQMVEKREKTKSSEKKKQGEQK